MQSSTLPDRKRGLSPILNRLSKQRRWEEMPAHITDDILETYVTVGAYAELGGKLIERYNDVVTGMEFSIAENSPEDRDRLDALVKELRAA